MRQLASAACLVCAVSSVALAGDPPRFPQQGFGAQIMPNLLAADLDHDGALDVAGSGESLALFYGSGDGRFLPGAPPPGLTASDPYEPFVYVGAVAVADFDGDGLSELVASSSGYVPYQHALVTIAVDASRNATVIATAGCGSLSDLAVADFDGDGRPDLAACSGQYTGIEHLELYLGGAAGFLLAGGTAGLDPTTLRIAAGDLDGDGLPDVVTSGNEIQVWRSLGAVGFAAPVAANAQPESYSLAIADLDLDGDLDLLRGGVNQSDYPLGASLNPGDGDFSAAAQAIDGTAQEFGVDVADLDADGVPDFVESNADGVVWGLGQQDGSFLTHAAPGVSFPQWGLATGDFDGDGREDVVAGGGWPESVFELLRGTPDGGLGSNVTSPGSGPLAGLLDTQGDGDVDALTLRNLGGGHFLANVHQGEASGAFTPAWSLAIDVNTVHLYAADFIEDGRDDVVVQKGLSLLVHAGGAGGLSTDALPPQIIDTPDDGAVGDVDLDGHLDLVLSRNLGGGQPGVRVYRGDGAGHFVLSGGAPAPNFKSSGILLGDVDGDGAPDAGAVSFSGTVAHVLRNDAGSFHKDHVQPSPQVADGLADVNGDGYADLLGKAVFEGDGAFHFAGIGVPLVGIEPPALADLDGDGALDLVAGATSTIAVMHNLGDAHFETSYVFAGGFVDGAGIADVDHDGQLDLVASAHDYTTTTRTLAVTFQQDTPTWSKLGHGKPGVSHEVAALEGSGTLVPDSPVTLALHDATPGAATLLLAGLEQQDLPFKGGVLVPSVDIALALVADAEGGWRLTSRWPAAVPAGLDLYLQAWIADAGVSHGQAASQGLRAHAP